jgi:hypothetical protein
MEKADKPNKVVLWTVQFQLFERRSRAEQWTQAADLRVDLDVKQNATASAVAAKGLSDAQAARALGPAADDARAARQGEISPVEAGQSIREIVR